MEYRALVTLILLTLTFSTFAQTQEWIQYYGQLSINENYSLMADGGFRWQNGFESSSQFIARASVRKHLTQSLHADVGLAYLGFYSAGDVIQYEYRPYQEFGIQQSLSRLGIKHRIRLEERFFRNNTEETGISNSFVLRSRYSLMSTFSIINVENGKGLDLLVGDEIFIHFGNNEYNLFDQNRILIGPAFRLNPFLKFTFLYNYLLSKPDDFDHLSIFWVGIRQRINI